MPREKKFHFPDGATPIDDCSGLIPAWVHHLDDLNRVEAENIMVAQRKYLRRSVNDPKHWFNVSGLQAIHRTMFENVWEWAGVYRQSMTSIGVKPSLIPMQLAELCLEVQSWLSFPVELTFLEMAARAHHRLVLIHPFENGNGRFSRLVADRFLLSFKCSHPLWPVHLNQEGIVRKDYIQTLKCADLGDYFPLVDFMKSLGASDPKPVEFFVNNFYKPWLNGEKGLSVMKALLKSGASPNDESSNGYRLLQLAIKEDSEELTKLFVSFGAEIDVQDQSGMTPLQTAVAQGNKKITEFLLSKGAKHFEKGVLR